MKSKRSFFVRSGDYEAVQTASSEDEAAELAVRYMIAEQIGCRLLVAVSRKGRIEMDEDGVPVGSCKMYLVPMILEKMGEYLQAELMYQSFREQGLDVDGLMKEFGGDGEVVRLKRELAVSKAMNQELKEEVDKLAVLPEEIKTSIESLEQRLAVVDEDDDIDDGDKWKLQ